LVAPIDYSQGDPRQRREDVSKKFQADAQFTEARELRTNPCNNRFIYQYIQYNMNNNCIAQDFARAIQVSIYLDIPIYSTNTPVNKAH